MTAVLTKNQILQIRELHRLYSVQKMLMDELKKKIKQNRLCGPITSSADHINQSQWMNWSCIQLRLKKNVNRRKNG